MGGYLSIGSGLKKGGKKFVRSTAHGLSYSFQKFIETASRAVALASLDPRFIRHEAERRNDVIHEPMNIAEGITAGVQAFTLGVGEGIYGIGLVQFMA